jgi:hypothetical protein
MDLLARCTAVKVELHAVSRKSEGPVTFKVYATLFARVFDAESKLLVPYNEMI